MNMKSQSQEWDQVLLSGIKISIKLKNMNWRNQIDEWDEEFYEDRPRKGKLPKMKDVEKSLASKKRKDIENKQ